MESNKQELMMVLIKVIQKLEPLKGDARTLFFIMNNQDQDLLEHIDIPPPHANIEELTLKD